MKENREATDTNVGDIEEAIERLEYIDRTYSCNNYYSIWDLKCIEIILSDYKRVLKENEELKEDRDKFKKALGRRITYCNELEKDLFENSSNYVIKKQKVKEKIEELDKRIDFLNTELTKCYIEREKLGTETDIDNNETYIFYMEEEKNFREKQEEVLQELLREE